MIGARGFRLSEDERFEMKAALEIAHGNKDYSLGLKLRSVLAAGDGRRQREVATVFNVPLRTLEWWIQRSRSGGIPGLLNGPYPGKASRLSAEQKSELALIIEDGPEARGLDTRVWTAPVVADVVAQTGE